MGSSERSGSVHDRPSDAVVDCRVHGAGRGGEGLCLELRLGDRHFLLDCGLADLTPVLERGDRWDGVLCSHAHRDHTLGLLEFQSRFPDVPVYVSEVTRQLLPLSWGNEVVAGTWQGVPWRSPIPLTDDISLELFPAGHLPGAALFVLTYSGGETAQDPVRVIYTGDFFLSNSRLVEGLPLEELRSHRPDVLILEGSYGTARHGRRRPQENAIADQICHALEHGQSIVMPLPRLGLSQELIMLLRSHHRLTGRDVTIWVDGAIARSCDAYLGILDQLPNAVQNFARHQNLFWDDRVRPRLQRLPEGDELLGGDWLEQEPGPVIVLADYTQPLGRYLGGGRSWRLLLAENSPGSLMDRAFQAAKTHQGTVDFYMLSEHCDGLGTLQLIHNLRPQHAVLVHGEVADLQDLAALEELNSRYKLHCPETGAVLPLPIAQEFQQPTAPVERYEGEVLKTPEGMVEVQLPQAIARSKAWQAWADTGIVEARWDGDELVLRGLSQQELMATGDRWVAPDRHCCQTCRFYRAGYCRNGRSPMTGRQVAADGACSEFEPVQQQRQRA